MPNIITANGHKTHNLRPIREYCGKHLARMVHIIPLENGGGRIVIRFYNDKVCRADFASMEVLKYSLRNWRNLRGTDLWVNYVACGVVEHTNKSLMAVS